ncbi:N-formylglutamate amidohydrolase [Kaustia mangrovi]|uniref:N-formylglutamate amidohydrolase n=1 Tax=Kaustia mangrovi TaxID=2593653 RepID=A0A7S8C2Y0_9HYPH|nr:N-formylglutamate amidohydrolase [Kaustia mangrovi]QPC42386.1 N-formylglutamate amidohydrolase [Kaustia mangrovi]
MLLGPGEPSAVTLVNGEADSRLVLVCEHASPRIPRALGTLGLSETELERHIAWDIGARAVAERMAHRLGAPLFVQNYSRLVCDCNRNTTARDFIPDVSERTAIPGNRGLSESDIAQRVDEIFTPFHAAIAAHMDALTARRGDAVFVTVHSFTPVFKDVERPWHVGVLFNRDPLFSPLAVELLRAQGGLAVGVNEPYVMSDETDYTVPVHGEARGVPSVEFEIRNDLVRTAAGQEDWADRLSRVVEAAIARMDAMGAEPAKDAR